MPTTGQATYLHTNINSFVALVFIGSFGLGVALIVLQAATGDNPIADFIVQTSALKASVQQ